MYQIEIYVDEKGRSPFVDWLDSLDKSIKAKVAARILRFETGNLGDTKTIGHGIFEARLHVGPGYRIYFGISGRQLIVLLVGGLKRTQKKDITKADMYWLDWKEKD